MSLWKLMYVKSLTMFNTEFIVLQRSISEEMAIVFSVRNEFIIQYRP